MPSQSKTKGMGMAWTTPKTWTSEPLTSLDLNTYMRDNQNYLRDRLDNSVDRILSTPTVMSTSSLEFVDVDATQLSLTLVTLGGDVLVGFTGSVQMTSSNADTYFNLAVDGVDYVSDDGIMRAASPEASRYAPISFVVLVTDLAAGSHTFKLRWKTSHSNNTTSMKASALHPQFWAKEI